MPVQVLSEIWQVLPDFCFLFCRLLSGNSMHNPCSGKARAAAGISLAVENLPAGLNGLLHEVNRVLQTLLFLYFFS